jgi:iron complex outermembrane receptor protein
MTSLNRAVLLATISFAAVSAAHAQTPAPAASESAEAEAPAETIVVTGTRRTDRTVADSPVPVDVIGGQQLTQTGLTETNKILNQLVPSFNFPQPSIADGTDVLRPASLRGLSPDQTLVLVNGKRRHVSALLNINGTVGRGSAAVDLNLIPALAIERIEVLRDGASSQYGSDAIAGVINIQLKKASEGGTATATYGKYVTTMDGVANVTGLQTAGGQPVRDATDNRYFAATTDGELKERDGAMYTLGANFGLPIGSRGYVNFTAEYRDRNPTNRSGFDLRPNYIATTLTAADPRETSFNRRNFLFGDAKTEDFNLFLNSGYELSDAFELYFFGSYGKRDGLSAANYRQQNAAANRDFSTLTPATAPSVGNFVALTPDGFLPKIATDLKDIAFASGVRVELGAWSLDFSSSFGRNKFDFGVRDSLNTSLGPTSPRVFDAGGLRYTQSTMNLDVSREYDAGFATPLSVALGAEYRKESFEIRPGELASYQIGPFFRAAIPNSTAASCATAGGVLSGTTCTFPGRAALAGAQGFPGIPASSQTSRSRHNFAGYVELDTDPLPGLTTTVAARYEDYSDFGSTFNAKFAARYEVVDGFALRGSISNGFRAPSLHQQYFTTTSTNFIGGLPVDIATVAVNSPVARALGSQDLNPEKSKNLTLGFTANPVSGLTFTFDYYRIGIDDRIVLTENLGAAGAGTAAVNAAVKAVLDANNFQSVGAARFFINGLDTTTEGFDAVLTYRLGTESFGTWNLSAAYNSNDQKIDRRINALVCASPRASRRTSWC